MTAEARAVLDDPRIDLPDSARWDILAGEVSPALLRLMSRAADEAAVRIGSPWALDGLGGRSFTDVVHQDHLHIAVRE